MKFEPLVVWLRDPGENVRQQAQVSLKQIGGEQVQKILERQKPRYFLDWLKGDWETVMAKPKQTILYTRTGDEGYTKLLGQERVPKYDLRPEAYGTVDEATSFMGMVRAEPTASERTKKLILETQRDLWILMGELAASAGIDLPKRLELQRISWLESEIDKLSNETPPLTQFVLPGDTKVGAMLDVARTVVRRAERIVAQLVHEGYLENVGILRYLNRLSSLLFALARYEEHLAGQTVTLAKKTK